MEMGLFLFMVMIVMFMTLAIYRLNCANKKLLKIVKDIHLYSQEHYIQDIRETIEEKIPESSAWEIDNKY
jgi:hypothetical protein